MISREKCSICGDLLVSPIGPLSSTILFVGDFPNQDDQKQGRAFAGKTGDILKAELAKVGIQLSACRATNLWQHDKNEEKCKISWHMDTLAKEFKNKKYILFMGSDVTQVFFAKSAVDLYGMKVKYPLIPDATIYVSPNPAFLLHGPVGEFRLALKNFKESMK